MYRFNEQDYNFLDFGASKGGCIEFAKLRLGGEKGLGIDIDPIKVEFMKNMDMPCMLGDITQLDIPENAVEFVTLSHVLEHLPNLEIVEKSLKEATRIASKFIFIQGPYFDADDYLESLGIKFYWSDWLGHPCHLKLTELVSILDKLDVEDYVLKVRSPVLSSDDPAIHPLNSPIDQQEYDQDTHPPKPDLEFSLPIYKEFVCYVKLADFDEWEGILEARKQSITIDAPLDYPI